MIHHLKCWPHAHDAVKAGEKKYEIRSNTDRDFSVGDSLWLHRWDPAASYTRYTQGCYVNEDDKTVMCREDADVIVVVVTHITHGGRFGLPPGLCVMGLR